MKGASRGLEGGLRRASRGLQGGLRRASRGLEKGFKGASRGLQALLTFVPLPPPAEGPFKPPLKGTFEGGGSDPAPPETSRTHSSGAIEAFHWIDSHQTLRRSSGKQVATFQGRRKSKPISPKVTRSYLTPKRKRKVHEVSKPMASLSLIPFPFALHSLSSSRLAVTHGLHKPKQGREVSY